MYKLLNFFVNLEYAKDFWSLYIIEVLEKYRKFLLVTCLISVMILNMPNYSIQSMFSHETLHKS